MKLRSTLAAGLLAAALPVPALAGSITSFSDRALFTAAVGGSPTVDRTARSVLPDPSGFARAACCTSGS